MNKIFNFKHLKGDVFGGITAGIVTLPLVLAFGVSTGLGASAGLYGAIFISFFAALFGGTKTMISGPTTPMTAVSMIVSAGIIASFNGDLSKALPVILTVFLLGGIFQIGIGLIGLGKYIKYVPYPVVSGFMSAIGVIILTTQLIPALGYYPKEDVAFVKQFEPFANEVLLNKILKEEIGDDVLIVENFQNSINQSKSITQKQITAQAKILAKKDTSGVLGSIKILPKALKNINLLELLLVLGTLFIIYGFKRITKKIPSSLIALLVMSGIAVGFRLDYRKIDEIPSGLPAFHFDIFTNFSFETITPYIFAALTLTFLSTIDTLLSAVVAENMTKTKNKPNKELIGQGIGNIIGSLFGGIPGAGSTTRTMVNIEAGGKTRLSGMVSGLFLLVVLLILSPVASLIPVAVLSGVLISIGISVIDYKGLRAIPYMQKTEVIIMFAVLILSSIWNLVFAVGIGLITASLIFMKKIGDMTSEHSNVKYIFNEETWTEEYDFSDNLKGKVYVMHIKGPLFFGSISDFKMLMKQIPDSATIIIIRMGRMQYIDQSGLFTLEDALKGLRNQNKTLILVNVLPQPRVLFEKSTIIPNIIPINQIFLSFEDSMIWLNKNN